MEKEILKEICEDLNLKEKIVVKLFKKIFIKAYHKARIKMINVFVR